MNEGLDAAVNQRNYKHGMTLKDFFKDFKVSNLFLLSHPVRNLKIQYRP
jgi:hypothetical protein